MSERKNGRTVRAHPIKQVLRDRGQSQSWVARRIGLGESYVRGMVAGVWPASPRFRAGASALLGLPESDLFHLDDASGASASGDTDGSECDHAGVVVTGAQAYPTDEEAPIGIPA